MCFPRPHRRLCACGYRSQRASSVMLPADLRFWKRRFGLAQRKEHEASVCVRACVGGGGGGGEGTWRVSPAVCARQTCVVLGAHDAPTFRDDSSVTVQLVFLWVINTQ